MSGRSRGRARSRCGGTTFLPTQLSGCTLWLRADRGVTQSGTVSAWTNYGSIVADATQGTGGSRPTYNASGFGAASSPYLSFDGTDDYMDFALGAVGTAYTFVFAARYRAYTTSNCIASATNSGLLDYLADSTTILGLVNAGTNLEHHVNGVRGAITRPTANTPAIVSTLASSNSTMRVNGTAGTPVALGSRSLNAATLRIGARSTAAASNFSTVDIAECVGFARLLSTYEITILEKYFGRRYGIALA